jgi:nucleoside-diphosphate-sugar epimerase
MRALVTGANGFVGSTLCRKLVERGDIVRGLVRRTSDLGPLEGVSIERVTGDLLDRSSLAEASRGVDVVYHVAAAVTDWGPLEYFRGVNVQGTRNVLDAAVESRARRFVYVSSTAVHGFGAQDMDEDTPMPDTRVPYCQSKREAEALVFGYHNQAKIQATVVRPGDLYGPGDRVVLLSLAGLLESGWLAYIGRGDKLGAFTYVENLADALILAGNIADAAGEAYVITDGLRLTWRDYLVKLTAVLNLPRPRFSIHPSLAYAAAWLLESTYRLFHFRRRPPLTLYLVAHMSGDYHFRIDKARRELGYEPRVGLEDALARTAAWYRRVVRGEPVAA